MTGGGNTDGTELREFLIDIAREGADITTELIVRWPVWLTGQVGEHLAAPCIEYIYDLLCGFLGREP